MYEKVSIIVPVFNSAKYLRSCIESIINQSYENIEIILVDDGSSDDSLKICNEYALKDYRIKVFHQSNKGVSSARNTGLENMAGEFFTFVDSDDELTQNAIEILLQDIHSYNADLTSAVKNRIRIDGTLLNKYEDQTVTIYQGVDPLVLSLQGDSQTNSVCAKLFKRSMFGKLRFVEGRHVNEDGFFLFEAYALKPTVVQHNINVYLYYERDGSNSRSAFSDKYFDMLYFVEKKKEIINKDFPELSNLLMSMEVRVNLMFLEILCRTTNKKYKQAQKNSINLVRRFYSSFDCKDKHKQRMAWIVTHGFYPLYKLAVRLKHYI